MLDHTRVSRARAGTPIGSTFHGSGSTPRQGFSRLPLHGARCFSDAEMALKLNTARSRTRSTTPRGHMRSRYRRAPIAAPRLREDPPQLDPERLRLRQACDSVEDPSVFYGWNRWTPEPVAAEPAQIRLQR